MKNIILIFTIFSITSFSPMGANNHPKNGKEKLIKYFNHLEANPLDKDSKKYRKWALNYIEKADASEILVMICEKITSQTNSIDSQKYKFLLSAQYTIAMASFKLENKNKSENEALIQIAGVESMLKVYESILLIDPSINDDKLNKLLNKKKNNSLMDYIKNKTCLGQKHR